MEKENAFVMYIFGYVERIKRIRTSQIKFDYIYTKTVIIITN
jgi:hypothetical protein